MARLGFGSYRRWNNQRAYGDKGNWNSGSFYGRFGVSDDNLIAWFEQEDTRSEGSVGTWNEISSGNDLTQSTAAKQALLKRTNQVSYRDFEGTDDYMGQEVIVSHSGLTATDSRCSFAAGSYWVSWSGIDLSPYASSDYEVVLTDGSGVRAKAQMTSVVGSGLTLSESKIVNGTMEADANWADYNGVDSNTQDNTEVHGGSWARKAVAGAASEGIKGDTLTTTTGKLYVLNYWVHSTRTDHRVAMRNGANSGWILDKTDTITAGSYTNKSHYYVESAGGAGAYPIFMSMAACTFYQDDSFLKEVTDCAATGVHTGAWTVETGFDYNDVVAVEIRKSALSQTGDLSGVVMVRLDDGISAAQVFFSKYGAVGDYAFAWFAQSTGAIDFIMSTDGTVTATKRTDAAVFENNQTAWHVVGFSYDATAQTITMYDNGSVTASSVESGIIPASIFDNFNAFEVGTYAGGAGDFLKGDMSTLILFDDVLTAAEHLTLYKNLSLRKDK